MGPFKGKVPVFARLWPVRVTVRVSFTTGAIQSAILATAGLLVNICGRVNIMCIGKYLNLPIVGDIIESTKSRFTDRLLRLDYFIPVLETVSMQLMCLLRFGFYCFYLYCVLYLGALLRVSV